jgi:hypothetical protein
MLNFVYDTMLGVGCTAVCLLYTLNKAKLSKIGLKHRPD